MVIWAFLTKCQAIHLVDSGLWNWLLCHTTSTAGVLDSGCACSMTFALGVVRGRIWSEGHQADLLPKVFLHLALLLLCP